MIKKSLLTGTLLLASASAAIGQSWKEILKSPVTGERTTIAQGLSGEVFVGYREFQGGKITVKKWQNNRWSNVGDTAFSVGNSGSNVLAVDKDSLPVVAFVDVNKNWNITVMKYNGTKWDTLGTRGFSGLGSGDIDMAVAGGNIFVAHQVFNQVKVWAYNRSSNTWGFVGNNGIASVGFPGQGIDLYGMGDNIYLAYRDNNSNFHVRTTDATNPGTSSTWSTVQGSFTASMSNLGLRLTNIAGNLMLNGVNNTTSSQVSLRYTPGRGWGQMSEVIGYKYSNNAYEVHRGPDSFPVFVIRDNAGFGRVLKLTSAGYDSLDQASTLINPTVISGNDRPRILHATDGNIYVVYQENGTSKLIVKQYCAKTSGMSVISSATDSFCANSGTVLRVNTTAQVQWYKNNNPVAGNSNGTLTVNEGSEYKAKLKNSCGDSSFTAVKNLFARNNPTPFILQNGNTLETQNYTGYQWYFNDILIPTGGNARTYTPANGGAYKVLAYLEVPGDGFGCSGESPEFNWWPLSAGNAELQDVMIYPNPAGSIINIRTAGPATLTIENAAGATIWTGQSDGFISIPSESWAKGVYIIRHDKGGAAKIIKQ